LNGTLRNENYKKIKLSISYENVTGWVLVGRESIELSELFSLLASIYASSYSLAACGRLGDSVSKLLEVYFTFDPFQDLCLRCLVLRILYIIAVPTI
jgi:hypothetical protein